MAETLISPGVLARENDQSKVTSQPITVGAAIIGPTAKGPVEIPTIVTTYSQFQNLFGSTFISGSQVYTYFTSIAAYNYFANGGESLLVARIVSGTYAPATSTAISSSVSASNQPAFALETLSKGDIMNSFTSASGTNGTLASGSINNLRWQILNSNTSSGTFDLLIRQGNDTTTSPIVLETWTNLSLDPTQANYVAAVLGDQVQNYNSTTVQITVTGSYTNRANYVRVSSVTSNTPFYFDNNGSPKSQFTSSLPLNASGSFSGGTGNMTTGSGAKYYDAIVAGVLNSQGAVGANYTNMINLLSNQDDYRFNVILTPGLIDSGAFASSVTSIITNTQNRGDNIYVVDQVPYGAIVNDAVVAAATRNTSYAATYWPWLQTVDPDSGQRVWIPASTMIGGVYAYNDNVSEPWFAPAGINRGGLSTVIRAEQKLPQSSRDTLYSGKVNPIATFPGTGTVVYGQKTLQTISSALDRVNVRRLLIALKSYISQVANNLVFEQNTIATRNQFLSQVNPYLESVQQRQGLYAFRVIMDDSNNTPDVIDRNQMVGQIYLQPTKTAEFIYLDFNILPTGATFPG
jgi:hypothetical protein